MPCTRKKREQHKFHKEKKKKKSTHMPICVIYPLPRRANYGII